MHGTWFFYITFSQTQDTATRFSFFSCYLHQFHQRGLQCFFVDKKATLLPLLEFNITANCYLSAAAKNNLPASGFN
jgi:hypothetical protein